MLTESTITHTVIISGGADEQMEGMGRGITANLPNAMDKLLSMVSQ